MEPLVQRIKDAYIGYWDYLSSEILWLDTGKPWWENYFYWLLGISLLIWGLEIIIPWRKKQAIIRKDFWLDGFYMFFNFFLFSLIGYNALSFIAVDAFNELLSWFGINNLVAIEISNWPRWSQFLLMFLLADFIQWNIHRLLHRYPILWEFHKVHHSVEEMGFAAHLRFHWMETIIYKSGQYLPLAMIGFGIQDFFIIHIVALLIGHLNHSNLNITYGPLKYIINNPAMHIWHHAWHLPKGSYGVNYGISLSLWDYLFGTAYIPKDGRDIALGFDNLESFPKTFLNQIIYPWKK